MIKAIEIEGFRSIRSLRFELKPLNVLIGPNQAGKTNLLDALDLLMNAVQGRLTDSLYQSRGGLTNLLWAGEGPRRLRYRVEFDSDDAHSDEQIEVTYSLTVEERSQGHTVAQEDVSVGPADETGMPPQNLHVAQGEGFVVNKRVASLDAPAPIKVTNLAETLVSQLRDPKAYPTLDRIRRLIGSIAVYPGIETKARWACDSPNETPQIRQPQFVQLAPALAPSGDNLVNVLYTLSQDEEHWESFKEDVRIGFPDFETIVFPPDAGQGRISLAWVDRRFPRKRFPAEVLSAGTLSFLAMAALFASPEPKGLIGIDEPEAHLHPELLYRLVGLMEKASARRQLIVTTHSDALLSYLSDPTDVVLVENGPEGTTLTRPRREDLEAWLKTYSLGQLREAGYLAAFGSAEQRL